MKKIIFAIALSLCIFAAKAQENVRRWEGEVFAGANVGIGHSRDFESYDRVFDSNALIGYTVGGGARYNFRQIPLGVGLQAAYSAVGYNDMRVYDDGSIQGEEYWNKDYSRLFTVAAAGDWSFNRGGGFSPFVGAGIGVAIDNSRWYDKCKVLLTPRVGVDINDKFRVSLMANISDITQNNISLTFAYRFGGTSASRFISDDTPDDTKARIKKLVAKSNACRWTGVGMLCVGVPVTVSGLVLMGGGGEVAPVLGGVVAGVGGLVTLSSIPLFIVSNKKKHEAQRLSLQVSAMTQPQTGGAISATPGLGLSLSF